MVLSTRIPKPCTRCGERLEYVNKDGKCLSWCIPCLNSNGKRKRRFLTAVKETCGCIDCGTREGRLDFDHRPGTIRLFNLAHPRCSWARLLAELEKCDVRCASCHTRRHWREKRLTVAA